MGGSALRAYSMNSGKVFAGTAGFTARKNPFDTRLATGARSFSGSKGICLYICALITNRLSFPTSSVYPSAGDFATSSPAMLPLLPTRFSTTTGWPSASESLGARMRPTRSGPPPGGKGTTRWIGREGYCASAAWARNAKTNARSLRFTECVPGHADSIQIHLPYLQVSLAGSDHGVFHVQLLREALDRAPPGVGVRDVGLLVQLEELELAVGEAEELPPALALQPEPSVLLHRARAVAGNVRALGAGVGDDAFQPMTVRHQALPRRPGELRARDRLRALDFLARKPDARPE